MENIDRRRFLRASGLTGATLALLPLAATHRALTRQHPQLRSDELTEDSTGHIDDHKTIARVLHELLGR